MKEASSPAPKRQGNVRQSNMELFRIIATFLVMLVHADFFSLGCPDKELLTGDPSFSCGQLFIQALSITCVNLFVLLSGWFGIRQTLQGFAKFVFQCLFFLIGIYVTMTLSGLTDLSPRGILKGIAGCFALLKWNWFIKAYICLYIIAPMINTYIENAGKEKVFTFLISFFAFQTIYSWISDSAVFFEAGYSTISFIGLYALARYVRLYSPGFSSWNKWYYLFSWLFISLLLSLCAYASIMSDVTFLLDKIYSYVNPLVIVSALSLLLFFSKIHFQNSFVNFVGASSFAAFLLHTNPNLCVPYFVPAVQGIAHSHEGFTAWGYIILFLCLLFILAIIVDQIRIFLWNRINRHLFKKRIDNPILRILKGKYL